MHLSLSNLAGMLPGQPLNLLPAPSVLGSDRSPLSSPLPAEGTSSSIGHDAGMAHVRSQVDGQLGIPSGSAATAAGSGYSSEDVAGHVLDFVARRLQQAAAGGDGTDQLRRILDAARQGVAKGFQQARDALQGTGRMTDGLDQSISASLAKINGGLDSLARQFGVSTNGTETKSPTGVGADQPVAAASGGQTAPATQAAAVEYASSESLTLSVRTAEGDQVRIRMSERQYLGASASYQSGGSGAEYQFSQSAGFAGRYQISVQGHLNAREQQAIGQLLGKVQDVASRFFSGDVQNAFDLASGLSLDGSQLARFSLNLKSVQSVRAATYSENQPAATKGADSAVNVLAPAGDLAAQVQQARNAARPLGLDAAALHKLFSHIVDGTLANRPQSPQANYRTAIDRFLRTVLGVEQPRGSGQLSATTGSATRPAS